MTDPQPRTRILHVVWGFSVGGLENVIVQLINRLPAARYEHAVVSLTTISDFRNRVTQPDVQFFALDKPSGHAVALYPALFRLFRTLRPAVIHTCNLAALETMPIAWLAGIPLRVHAEHGWDMNDPSGANRRMRLVRRLYRPFVQQYVAVSQQIFDYQRREVGVPAARLSLIANGVDTARFAPRAGARVFVPGYPFIDKPYWIVGTVGRLQPVKNQALLARAFVRLLREHPTAAEHARLVMIGEGAVRPEIERILREGGALEYAWLPGARDDVPEILAMLDCFVLSSHAEGTSCTLQEAMASGLPAIVTDVGGNPMLVDSGTTGYFVPPDRDDLMAAALWRYLDDRPLGSRHGDAARRKAVATFGIDRMIDSYDRLFSTRTP